MRNKIEVPWDYSHNPFYNQVLSYLNKILDITSENIENNKMSCGQKASKAIRKAWAKEFDIALAPDLPVEVRCEIDLYTCLSLDTFIQRIFDRVSSLQETVYISALPTDFLQAGQSNVFSSCYNNLERDDPKEYSGAPIAMGLSAETLVAYVPAGNGLKKRVFLYINQNGFAIGRHYGQWSSVAIDALKEHCKYMVQSMHPGLVIPKWYHKEERVGDVTGDTSKMVYCGDAVNRYSIARSVGLEVNIPDYIICPACGDTHRDEGKNGLCSYCHDDMAAKTEILVCSNCTHEIEVDVEDPIEDLHQADWTNINGEWHCPSCYLVCQQCLKPFAEGDGREVCPPNGPDFVVCDRCFEDIVSVA